MSACCPHKAFCLDLQAGAAGEDAGSCHLCVSFTFPELGLSTPAPGAASCPGVSAIVMQRSRATSGLMFYKPCVFCIAQAFRQQKY